MKVFDQQEPWPDKVDFVDHNNVVVGFDMGQYCCEQFGFHFTKDKHGETIVTVTEEELAPYVFDTSRDSVVQNDGCAIFRLWADDKPDLYLVLFNHHNGYYSHGFAFKNNDVTILTGQL